MIVFTSDADSPVGFSAPSWDSMHNRPSTPSGYSPPAHPARHSSTVQTPAGYNLQPFHRHRFRRARKHARVQATNQTPPSSATQPGLSTTSATSRTGILRVFRFLTRQSRGLSTISRQSEAVPAALACCAVGPPGHPRTLPGSLRTQRDCEMLMLADHTIVTARTHRRIDDDRDMRDGETEPRWLPRGRHQVEQRHRGTCDHRSNAEATPIAVAAGHPFRSSGRISSNSGVVHCATTFVFPTSPTGRSTRTSFGFKLFGTIVAVNSNGCEPASVSGEPSSSRASQRRFFQAIATRRDAAHRHRFPRDAFTAPPPETCTSFISDPGHTASGLHRQFYTDVLERMSLHWSSQRTLRGPSHTPPLFADAPSLRDLPGARPRHDDRV